MANARHSVLLDVGSTRHVNAAPWPPRLAHWLPDPTSAQKGSALPPARQPHQNGIAKRHSQMLTPISSLWRLKGRPRRGKKAKNWACSRGLAPPVSALFDPATGQPERLSSATR